MIKNRKVGINADSGTIDGDFGKLSDMLSFFENIGFDYVEIPVHGIDCIINGKLISDQVQKTRKILKNYDLSYTVHAPDCLNLMSLEDPKIQMQALKSTIDFSSEIESDIVVYHSSYSLSTVEHFIRVFGPKYKTNNIENIKNKVIDEEIERFRCIGDYASEKGVKLAVENHYLGNPEICDYGIFADSLVEIIERVNHANIGICYDFGHGYIASAEYGFDFLQAVEKVLKYAFHVHVHDNFGKMGVQEKNIDRIFVGQGDLHLPIGWGSIPYEQVFEIIRNKYNGIIMFEIQPRFMNYLELMLENITKYRFR